MFFILAFWLQTVVNSPGGNVNIHSAATKTEGSLKERAIVDIHKYCKAISEQFKRAFGREVSLRGDYLPMDLEKYKQNPDSNQSERWTKVDGNFNDAAFIAQLTENYDTTKRWIVEVSLDKS